MTYYGIVDKIKDEHKNGVYGRRQLTKEEIAQLKSSENNTTKHLISGIVGGLSILIPFATIPILVYNFFFY